MTFWQGVLRPKYPFEGLKILKHGRLHVRKYCEEWTHASMHQLCYLKQRHTHNKVHLTIVPKKNFSCFAFRHHSHQCVFQTVG